MNTSTLVQKLRNYCNVLRDDGMSYGDCVEQQPGTLALNFGKAQNRLQHLAKLRRVIVDLNTRGAN